MWFSLLARLWNCRKGVKMTQQCLHVGADVCPVSLLQCCAERGIKMEQTGGGRQPQREHCILFRTKLGSSFVFTVGSLRLQQEDNL